MNTKSVQISFEAWKIIKEKNFQEQLKDFVEVPIWKTVDRLLGVKNEK